MTYIALKPYANGHIHLHDSTLEINDKSSRMPSGLFKLFPWVFMFIGGYQVYKGMLSENEGQMVLYFLGGFLLLLIPALLYHSNFKRTNQKTIQLNTIDSVTKKKLLGEILIDIQLSDGATRRVYNIRNISDWETMKIHLTDRNIKCVD